MLNRASWKALGCGLVVSLATTQAASAAVIFDDFNTNEGHFNSNPIGGSGSTNGIVAPSDATHTTTGALEGDGAQQIVLVPTAAGNSARLRHLSGAGSAANNTAFTTSAANDGWIGLYLKTAPTDPATTFTVQIWLEGASNNGSTPKTVIADGEWHLYEWDLEATTKGAPDGWGDIAGILGGVGPVADGSHTLDSVIFRTTALNAEATIFMDFVAKSDSGSIAALVPEPAGLSLAGLALLGLTKRRRK